MWPAVRRLDPDRLYGRIAHYYMVRKNRSREEANRIARNVVRKEISRRTCSGRGARTPTTSTRADRGLHGQRVRVRRVLAGTDIGEASIPCERRCAANSSTKPWTVSTFCAPERTTILTSSGKSQWSLSGNE